MGADRPLDGRPSSLRSCGIIQAPSPRRPTARLRADRHAVAQGSVPYGLRLRLRFFAAQKNPPAAALRAPRAGRPEPRPGTSGRRPFGPAGHLSVQNRFLNRPESRFEPQSSPILASKSAPAGPKPQVRQAPGARPLGNGASAPRGARRVPRARSLAVITTVWRAGGRLRLTPRAGSVWLETPQLGLIACLRQRYLVVSTLLAALWVRLKPDDRNFAPRRSIHPVHPPSSRSVVRQV